jgi:PDZ domain-containing secreted protein
MPFFDPETLESERNFVSKNKFDSKHRNKFLRRQLHMSLKTEKAEDGIFVFDVKLREGNTSDLKMGDTIIGIQGRKCHNLDQFISLLGYGEDETLNLTVDRHGAGQIDCTINFN